MRSGVVLSDGLLITAAEIVAMETVPEVVFLNCCHLGKVDYGRDGNKLAASIARELIEIGVRCVVVAGWAVSDDKAQRFGEAFYEHLLLRRQPFGDAVFEARKTIWEPGQNDITWGAFQAYGDPGWLAEPRADNAAALGDGGLFASPDELLDELARIRVGQSRRRASQSEREARAQVARTETILQKRCPPGWLAMPQLQSALGATWLDLGEFDKARVALLRAVQTEDKTGHVPIKDVEKLANIEARLGEERGTLRGAADSANDPDFDGYTNASEYVADTHPKNANSRPSCTLVAGPGNQEFTIHFLTSAQRTYTVQFTEDLTPDSWEDLEPPFAGTGSEMTITDTLTTERRFYRIRIALPSL